MQLIPPSPARPSARSLMVNAIIARLADGIIAETTSHATQNVCESILRELWADYSVRETAARSSYVNELSRGLVQDIVGAGVRQIVGSICCDNFHAQRLRRGVFRQWKGATERVIQARLQDMERQSRIKRFAATALAGDPKGKGRELWSDEEEEDEYAELRFDELAIESSVDVGLLRGDATDGDMATLVREVRHPAAPTHADCSHRLRRRAPGSGPAALSSIFLRARSTSPLLLSRRPLDPPGAASCPPSMTTRRSLLG